MTIIITTDRLTGPVPTITETLIPKSPAHVTEVMTREDKVVMRSASLVVLRIDETSFFVIKSRSVASIGEIVSVNQLNNLSLK
jgi:hypothetical protein